MWRDTGENVLVRMNVGVFDLLTGFEREREREQWVMCWFSEFNSKMFTHVQDDITEETMFSHCAESLQKRRLHRVIGVLEEAKVLHGIV